MIALLAGAALAVELSAPFGADDYGYYYPTAYYDHSGVDWACGSIRYSGHRGSDFGCGSWSGMEAGRDIVAAADGTVSGVNDGEFDECSTGDCDGGSGFGNYVKLTHDDGSVTYYAHMKQWTVAVSYGERVECGEKLGEVGSSGHSTGPHLHFEPRTSGNVAFDPFYGSCSTSGGYWIDQGSYDGLPGRACTVVVVDNDGDGYSQDDDCNDSSAAIHPGATEICDDGVDNDCSGGDAAEQWTFADGDGDGYGDAPVSYCGSRPGGTASVDGDCDDDEPMAHPGLVELCDGLDNDCNGLVDDGPPAEFGSTPPALAAALVDMSAPGVLRPGEQAPIWMVFENVGTRAWTRRDLWLRVDGADASPLLDESSWAAYDVVGLLDEDVPPGGTGAIGGWVRASEDASGTLDETFVLGSADGSVVRCPQGEVRVEVRVRNEVDSEEPAPVLGGCRVVAGGAWWLALPLLGLRRRKPC